MALNVCVLRNNGGMDVRQRCARRLSLSHCVEPNARFNKCKSLDGVNRDVLWGVVRIVADKSDEPIVICFLDILDCDVAFSVDVEGQ